MEWWSNGVVERWRDAAGGDREGKSPGTGFTPSHVPGIAILLLPIPIRSHKRIQQTSSSAPNRSPRAPAQPNNWLT